MNKNLGGSGSEKDLGDPIYRESNYHTHSIRRESKDRLRTLNNTNEGGNCYSNRQSIDLSSINQNMSIHCRTKSDAQKLRKSQHIKGPSHEKFGSFYL